MRTEASMNAGLFSPERLYPRFKAFAVHFAIGAAILAVLVYIIAVHWYPAGLFTSDGGLQGLYILIGVDLVLGPGLTFAAYDIAKSRAKIRFDLTVIGVLQALALIWGMYVIYTQHPAVLVYSEGRFRPVSVEQLRPQEINRDGAQGPAAREPPSAGLQRAAAQQG